MSLTKKSEKLIKHFIDDFDKYCVKKTADAQKSTDTVLKLVYRDIRHSVNYMRLVKKNNLLLTDVKKINGSLNKLPKSNLMDSSFMPGNIKDKILYNILGYMKGTITLSSIKINIYWGIFKESDFNKLYNIKNNILEVIKMIKFCTLNKNIKTVNTLDIYLYLTNEEKKLPNNKVYTLGPNNCNSAVTYACASAGKILIYRKEEWKKVLIHELFHSLCLDFALSNYNSLKSNVKKIFDVDSDYEITEAYSEYWATILNSCFISYDLLDNENDVEEFILFVEFCIQLERIFSLFQMIKILHYMGLNYSSLYKTDSTSVRYRKLLYKEDTNVLCYYVIKTIMLFFNDDFLKWCLHNNSLVIKFDKTQQNFTNLYKFIEDKYNKRTFLNAISSMTLFYSKKVGPYHKRTKKSDYLLTTSKMTICEN
tara:strand:- start:13120 stop:14388 length:1269 start_codon:yes stop_codon:yes gene_type:complete